MIIEKYINEIHKGSMQESIVNIIETVIGVEFSFQNVYHFH